MNSRTKDLNKAINTLNKIKNHHELMTYLENFHQTFGADAYLDMLFPLMKSPSNEIKALFPSMADSTYQICFSALIAHIASVQLQKVNQQIKTPPLSGLPTVPARGPSIFIGSPAKDLAAKEIAKRQATTSSDAIDLFKPQY